MFIGISCPRFAPHALAVPAAGSPFSKAALAAAITVPPSASTSMVSRTRVVRATAPVPVVPTATVKPLPLTTLTSAAFPRLLEIAIHVLVLSNGIRGPCGG